MPKIAPEPIEAPADDHVKLPPASVGHKPIECGPPVSSARDADVFIFSGHPTANLAVNELADVLHTFFVNVVSDDQ
jgi:hypothetical protein